MSFLSCFSRRRKYSTHSQAGFSLSLSGNKSRGGMRFCTHAAKSRRRKIVLVILGIVVLIIAVLFIFKSPYFQIRKIITNGNTTFTTDSATALLSGFLGENIFLSDTSAMTAKVNEEYPTIENLSIVRKLPNEIAIKADDFPIAWVLTYIGSDSVNRYLINTAGFVTGNATPENAVGLPILELNSDEELSSKEAVLPPVILKKILKLAENIESRFEIGVLKFKILDVAREIHLLMENNWTLRLMLDQDWDRALINLSEALRGQDISNISFEYIDLRVPDKIFFKEK